MAAQRPPRLADLSEDDRLALESWLAEFEHNWREGMLSGRASQIPPGSSWRLPALAGMVKIDLKRQWQAGRRVSLESYLRDFPELGRRDDVVLDLIRAESDVRRRFGAPVDVEEYAKRFPDQAAEMRRVIDPGGSQELPERFGRYRIIKRLGQGGMGSVFLAEDTELGRRVALKVSHFEAADSGESRERFSREARAAATLDHPFLCPVYDVGVIDGVHFLTMAYIEGNTLAASIREGGSPQRQVAAVIGKIAVALEEAHARGVVHRDLKPSNIMIKKTGQRREPVVVDFGLARQENSRESRMTRTGQALGTPAYMAPEQIRGDLKEIGPACDIYALGVMLYEMLTGRLPFVGSGLAVVGQILTQEPLPPSTHRADLDPRLEAICLKALAKKTSARYASMADLAAALTDFLKNPTPSSVSSPSRESGPRLEGVEARAAGSDTLVGRFLDHVATENASVQDQDAMPVLRRTLPPIHSRRLPRRVVIAASTFVLMLGLIVHAITNKGRIKIIVDDPNAVVKIDGDELGIETRGMPITLRAGTHKMEVTWGDGQSQAGKFVVRRGDNDTMHVEYEPTSSLSESEETGFQPLFNGKNLDGWRVHPSQPGFWRVEDGVLIGSASDISHLYSYREDFQDFHLRVKARVNGGGYSGVCFRSGYGPAFPADAPKWPRGFEALINSTNGNPNKTGSLYVNERPVVSVTDAEHFPGGWFTMDVIAEGNHIVVMVNGKTTADYHDPNSFHVTKGHIALQQYDRQTVVEFLQIEIKKLNATASGADASSTRTDKSSPPKEAASPSVPLAGSIRIPPSGPKRAARSIKGTLWSVEGDELIKEGSGPGRLEFGDEDWTDYDLTFEASKSAGPGGLGAVFRVNDPKGYVLNLGTIDHGHYLYRRSKPGEKSPWHRWNPGSIRLLDWYKVKISLRGPRIRIEIDDHQSFDHMDSFSQQGAVGFLFINSAGRFRNIKVTAPDGTTLWEGPPDLPGK